MRIEVHAVDIDHDKGRQGLEIGVVGFPASPSDLRPHPSQIYLEVSEGKLRIRIWNGEEDPVTTIVYEPLNSPAG